MFEELECSGAFRWQLAVAGSLYCILVVMFVPSYNKIRTLRRSRNNLEGLQLVDQKYKMLLAVSAIRIFQMAVSVASWTGAADVQRALYAIFVCTSQVSRVFQSVGWLVGWLVCIAQVLVWLVGCKLGSVVGLGLRLILAWFWLWLWLDLNSVLALAWLWLGFGLAWLGLAWFGLAWLAL